MKHYFVDTNVVIDMLADREGFAEAASCLFDAAGRGEIKVSVCALSFSTIYYILRRSIGREQSIKYLSQLTEYVSVASVDENMIYQALQSGFPDFEDAIQYYSALNCGNIEAIVTRNTRDFTHSSLPVKTPQEVCDSFDGYNMPSNTSSLLNDPVVPYGQD